MYHIPLHYTLPSYVSLTRAFSQSVSFLPRFFPSREAVEVYYQGWERELTWKWRVISFPDFFQATCHFYYQGWGRELKGGGGSTSSSSSSSRFWDTEQLEFQIKFRWPPSRPEYKHIGLSNSGPHSSWPTHRQCQFVWQLAIQWVGICVCFHLKSKYVTTKLAKYTYVDTHRNFPKSFPASVLERIESDKFENSNSKKNWICAVARSVKCAFFPLKFFLWSVKVSISIIGLQLQALMPWTDQTECFLRPSHFYFFWKTTTVHPLWMPSCGSPSYIEGNVSEFKNLLFFLLFISLTLTVPVHHIPPRHNFHLEIFQSKSQKWTIHRNNNRISTKVERSTTQLVMGAKYTQTLR